MKFFIRNINLSDIATKLFSKITSSIIDPKEITNIIFTIILNNLLEHGVCTIQNFGKFICYKTYSNRKNEYRIRIKFVPSTTLMNKLSYDNYIMNSIKVGSKVKFNSETVEGKEEIKIANYDAKIKASKEGIKSLQEQATLNIISNAIESTKSP